MKQLEVTELVRDIAIAVCILAFIIGAIAIIFGNKEEENVQLSPPVLAVLDIEEFGTQPDGLLYSVRWISGDGHGHEMYFQDIEEAGYIHGQLADMMGGVYTIP